jgi:hypothetical protein
VEVEVELVDGRMFRGIFSTATPFVGKKLELALKAATALNAPGGTVISDPTVEPGATLLMAFADLKTLTVSKKHVDENEGMYLCVFVCMLMSLLTLLSLTDDF